jgi:CheY-like chemotaxis protein
VHSLERLADELVRALHLDLGGVHERYRKAIDEIHGSTRALAGRRVLIVDDDIRNIFALSSVLEDYGMEIKTADNGRDAISVAQKGGIDVILMDIMMPEMDGLETTREIRKIEGCRDLPIIAVTAKAMKGDRERCIEAGAWDYLSKPVDREQLVTVLKAWLQR